ncbi:unnamed protein product [Ostreobium quekettii]|uniref:Uncharacterized protein n=1 Tax=Ostreobium quekettii TaxID=121088 RepID=A0A8S1IM12_9CHLO|nr:unnamed protein product [Ostreobium quekettii]
MLRLLLLSITYNVPKQGAGRHFVSTLGPAVRDCWALASWVALARRAAMNAAQVLDDEVLAAYRRLVQPHVESFNCFLREGLSSVVEGVRPVEIRHPVTQKIRSFWFGSPIIGQPIKTEATVGKEQRLFPRECRQSVVI